MICYLCAKDKVVIWAQGILKSCVSLLLSLVTVSSFTVDAVLYFLFPKSGIREKWGNKKNTSLLSLMEITSLKMRGGLSGELSGGIVLLLCYLKQHPADHWYLEDKIHSSIQFSKNCVQSVLAHICSMLWGWVAVTVLKIWNDWKLFNLSASERCIFVTDTNNLK